MPVTTALRATAVVVALLMALGAVPLAAPAASATTAAATPADKIDPAISRTSGALASVIVRAQPGLSQTARAAITAAGGFIAADLPIVDGFEASVPTDALHDVAASASVLSVSENAVGRFEEFSYDETTTASSFALTSGATHGWSKGFLGTGVGVAVIDTGVTPMRDFAGRLVHGPDLSGEASRIDTYGHGTVMAGVIAGSGADSASRTGGAYTGVAPGANIIAVKTAGANGVVDVSTILQAMHWIASYRQQYNIRVLNLSWGTKSTQSHTVDPLNYAVQRLWKSGIVVVVAAGNSGPNSTSVTKPGDDPMVITVGAYDDKGNTKLEDDGVASWSSRGPTSAGLAKPDIVAPGRTLVATRAFGSHVETTYPKAHIEPSYIKGSGSSQAAAVVSGVVAQLLQARPSLTPDQVKSLLRGTATPIGTTDVNTQGKGRVNLGGALTATPSGIAQTATATGLGLIDASRGGMYVDTDCNNDGVIDTIRGEIDVRCEPWEPAAWVASAWDGTAWMGDVWEAHSWADATWSGRAWTGGEWAGRAWTGRAWTGRAWTDSMWDGRAWTGAGWTGTSWTTAEYGEWTTAEYEEDVEFMTAWYGPQAPPGRLAELDAMDQASVPERLPETANVNVPPGAPAADNPVGPAPAADQIPKSEKVPDEATPPALEAEQDPAPDTTEEEQPAPRPSRAHSIRERLAALAASLR